MEPRIQYATTSDGVKIAYGTVGAGPPILVPHAIFEQFSLAWQMPEWRRFLEQLGEGRQLVMYDGRGFGLSERNVEDLSIEPRIRDMEAVVVAAKLRRFAVFASFFAGPVAVTYAVRSPKGVTHLILYGTGSRADRRLVEQWAAIVELCQNDWRMAAQILADLTTREECPEVAIAIAEHWRQAASGEIAAKRLSQQSPVDDLLPQVKIPTLVLHRRGDPSFAMGQQLAAGTPNARLVPLEGAINAYWLGDSAAVLDAIREFLSEGEEGKPAALPEGTAIILFLDIADSTALTTKLGDAAYREKERSLDGSLRAAITEAGGTPVEGKVLGDGVMAVFTSARQAIDAAQRCRDLGGDAGLPLHLGIHAGDVVHEGNNVHGGAVQMAARVQSAAAPGEILVSATVRDLARTSAGVTFEDRGQHELKGIAESQRLFAVRPS